NVKIGAAMIKALTEWVLRKGIAGDEREATGIAWAIAKDMQKRGIFRQRKGGGLGVLQELMKRHMPKIIKQEVAEPVRTEMSRGSCSVHRGVDGQRSLPAEASGALARQGRTRLWAEALPRVLGRAHGPQEQSAGRTCDSVRGSQAGHPHPPAWGLE